MPIEDAFPHGTPIWVDLQSPDHAAAAHYYRELFGWEVGAFLPETGNFALAQSRGVAVAAIGPLPGPDAPAAWTAYFSVDDLQAAADAALAAGGSVLLEPGEAVPGVWLAIVADPAGAVFGLWQRMERNAPWLRDEPGAVDWLELVASDPESTFAFYESVLGFAVSEMRVGEQPYGLFDVGETSVAGAYTSDGTEPAHWLVYFNVADLDAAVVRATELGGTLRTEPLSAPGVGRWAEIVDPHGAVFALLEPEPEPL
ncbi:VOC family protein [Leifsonia shinshuensis]|uniref:VOC family protein n=1 Tax=Leifsonia shinshuensis TaxID=150026 RepID=UPI002864282D|nr:VOC family protein [Leifsonia shinshuensis]MDR6970010.1 putative enzyme related to lactoylglutathione lyase [Leifsonia shinshuensis]